MPPLFMGSGRMITCMSMPTNKKKWFVKPDPSNSMKPH